MAGLLGKVVRFAGTPQGRAAIAKAQAAAQKAASDPRNRAKVESLVAKARGKGGPRQP